MCSLTDAFTLLVTLRPRLVTLGRCHSTQERVSVVCLSTLKVLPGFGFTLWVSSVELRRNDNKIQRLFTGGQSLHDVAASLRQGKVPKSCTETETESKKSEE